MPWGCGTLTHSRYAIPAAKLRVSSPWPKRTEVRIFHHSEQQNQRPKNRLTEHTNAVDEDVPVESWPFATTLLFLSLAERREKLSRRIALVVRAMKHEA